MATTTSSTTTRARTRGSGVELDALACPGCAEPVDTAPPASGEDGPVPGFCHRDGSELCSDGSGTAGEPVEFERLRWSASARKSGR